MYSTVVDTSNAEDIPQEMRMVDCFINVRMGPFRLFWPNSLTCRVCTLVSANWEEVATSQLPTG